MFVPFVGGLDRCVRLQSSIQNLTRHESQRAWWTLWMAGYGSCAENSSAGLDKYWWLPTLTYAQFNLTQPTQNYLIEYKIGLIYRFLLFFCIDVPLPHNSGDIHEENRTNSLPRILVSHGLGFAKHSCSSRYWRVINCAAPTYWVGAAIRTFEVTVSFPNSKNLCSIATTISPSMEPAVNDPNI